VLEPHDGYTFAKRSREQGDPDAAHKLVTSHLRLVAKFAWSYRGSGLPISEVISEGNVGLMIEEYLLSSWSPMKMGTTANQEKVFFNLHKAKKKISVLDDGDLRPEQVKLIAKRLGVTE
jgi:RNA polymerase sigma-32 factor